MSTIEIIESFIEGKNMPDDCEDALLVADNFVGVFDGMSSPLAEDSQRSGRLFATTARDACLTVPADSTSSEAIAAMTSALSDLGVRHAGPFGAVGAVYSVHRREIWRVGDIHIRINDRVYPGAKDVDNALASYRAAYNAAFLAADPDADIRLTDPGLAAATPLLTVQGHLANHPGPFGYGVFNGVAVPEELIEILPVSAGDEIVLATDGFLSPGPTLDAAQAELHAAQKRDPLALGELQSMAKCLRPGFRAHDDRTYLRFRVN